jgi:hypothetical protein
VGVDTSRGAAAPRSLYWLRIMTAAIAAGGVGAIVIRYGVGPYPSPLSELTFVRSVQYVVTGAVATVGALTMIGCLAVVAIGIVGTAFHLLKSLVLAAWTFVRSAAALRLVRLAVGAVSIAAVLAPPVIAIWITGGLLEFEFWVLLFFLLVWAAMWVSIPAALFACLVAVPLGWWARRRGRSIPSHQMPPGVALVHGIILFIGIVWMFLAASEEFLHPLSPAWLPHRHPGLGGLIVIAAVICVEAVVLRTVRWLEPKWAAVVDRQEKRHIGEHPVMVLTPLSKSAQIRRHALPATVMPTGERLPRHAEEEEEYWSPDFVTGWRRWTFDGERLRGMWQPWPGPTLEAECMSCEEVPGFGCQCGIYAVKTAAHTRVFSFGNILGKVELTGVVIEHEMGYRAGRATIVGLWAPDSSTADLLHSIYKCPVEVDPPITEEDFIG